MYQIILVDDENLFLDYLSNYVNWTGYGLNVKRIFTSSISALEYIKGDAAIDAVLTDIRMPGLSGIDLITDTPEATRNRIYYLVLSGYNDFSLVKMAFLAGARDYLLKVDVNTPEFDKAINRMKQHLESRIRDEMNEEYRHGIIDEIQTYIIRNLGQPLSLGKIAAQFGFSTGYLSAMFAKRSSVTLTDYIAQARIERAQHLLITTDKGVTEIAYDVGYNNLEHFSRTFKKYTGCAPREYRKFH